MAVCVLCLFIARHWVDLQTVIVSEVIVVLTFSDFGFYFERLVKLFKRIGCKTVFIR